MRKWVIKQQWPDAPLEVWEYLTALEEVKDYWYIVQAIQKYGEDYVLPVAMNDRGGYHPLPRDSKEIVAIIESDQRPKLRLFQMYSVNNANFRYGWLSPDCTSYSCSYMCHMDCANDIVDELYRGKTMVDSHADDFLLKNGWIKVTNSGWFGWPNKISLEQINFLGGHNIRNYLEVEKR